MSFAADRRRFRALAGVGSVVLSLTACVPAPHRQQQPSAQVAVTPERGPIMMAVPDQAVDTWARVTEIWNAAHPQEPITLRVLSSDPTVRHDVLAEAGKAKSGELTVMALDPSWIPEFGANGWLEALDAAAFPAVGALPTAVNASSYAGTRYGVAVAVDAGVLYYRKDLLAEAKLKVPRTWAELTAACDRIQQEPEPLACYGTGLQPSEALTVNAIEAIDSAGGAVVNATGVPTLDTLPARQGVQWLADAVHEGTIAADALDWDDAEASQAFVDGKLIFLRGWSGTWSQAERSSSPVSGRVGVVGLIGPDGPGVPSAGGAQFAIAAHARNAATAADVIRWLSSEPIQRELWLRASSAPALASLYTDPNLAKQPVMGVVSAAVEASRPRPVSPRYAECSRAISEALEPVVRSDADLSAAMATLQARLAELLK